MTRQEFLELLPKLAKNYRPAPDVIDHIRRISALLIVGPSGVGKTTLINQLGQTFVLSDNSRQPRPNEIEGEDFYFRADYDQLVDDIQNGQFVQIAVDGGGDLKATKASSYPDSGNVVMAVLADVVPIFRNLGFASTKTAFITPPSFEEWMHRIKEHNLSGDALSKRLDEAKRSLAFALNDSDTHFILSDEISPALEQLKNLIDGQKDEHREMKAKAAAKALLHKLN